MRILFFPIAVFLCLFASCSSSGTIKDVEWLIGNWQGTDVNGLVFNEHWERGSGSALVGTGATVKPDGDTLFHETLKIDLVESVPFYYYELPKTKEPVLYKMIQGDATNAIFENKDEDFPQRITYLLETKNTLKVKLEGIEKGIPKIETLEFERNSAANIILQTDSIPVNDSSSVIHVQ